jgi:hypothetical protein
VFEESVGITDKPVQAAHVANAPPQLTAFKPQSALALPQVQPGGQMIAPSVAAQNLAFVLATVYVLPGYAALHVAWLAAGLVGLEVE